jgi:hypothetical protein
MTTRIAGGMTRSAAAEDVARVFNVSVSTAYKSYLFDDVGTRRVPLKKSNVAREYNKCVQDGTLTVIYKILSFNTLRADSVAARVGKTTALVQYARKWGPKFKLHELKMSAGHDEQDVLEEPLDNRAQLKTMVPIPSTPAT